jgi:hypothetical protein
MENKRKFIECSCHNEIICIEDDESSIYLSMYEFGRHGNNTVPFWSRFRWIWHFLKTGCPYSDSVVLSKQDAFILMNELKSRL